MERLAVLVAGIVTLAGLAGCLGSDDEKEGGDAPAPPARVFENGLLVQEFVSPYGEPFVAKAAAGALTEITFEASESVSLPEGTLLFRDGRFEAITVAGVNLEANETLRFLVPPGAANVTAVVAHRDFVIETPYNATAEFVSGAMAVHLEKVQEDRFPHRTPGMPNYALAQQYFSEWFERLGYEVTIEPVPNTCPPPPAGNLVCPASIVNVVAYRQGTLTPERILAFGAHYDMVPQTTHAAFDDTSGTVEVLELARAFANVTT